MTSNRLPGLEKELKFRKRVMRWANVLGLFLIAGIVSLFILAFACGSLGNPNQVLMGFASGALVFIGITFPPWYLCMRDDLNVAKREMREGPRG